MSRLGAAAVAAIMVWAGAASASAETGAAEIRGTAAGSPVAGDASLTDTPAGLQVSVRVTGAAPGAHGLHIHQHGGCGDAGNDAGGHFNPDNVSHGFLPDDGLAKAHPGDLGNIEVNQDGVGELAAVLPGVTLSGGARSVAGRAIVLHEKADDFSQPTGNAGGRIGCGPILLVKP
jgi:Cu-Zn family superoxide dismutase